MKRNHKEVKVIIAPTSFPPRISSGPTRKDSFKNRQAESNDKKVENTLDLRETMREVYEMGSTLFEGKQKKQYESEKYKALTGRDKKQQRVPLKIRRGIQKKASIREARKLAEARDAGIVLKSTTHEGKTRDRINHSKVYGPVPSIGFTKKGILHVPKSMGNHAFK
jgi:hypothetical protein